MSQPQVPVAVPPPPGSSRGRGYTRVVVRILWWNIFHGILAAAWALLLFMDQGQELVRAYSENESAAEEFAEFPLRLLIPLFICAFLVTTSSFMAARAGLWQLERLVRNYSLDMNVATRIAHLYAPAFFGALPFLVLGFASKSRLWVALALLVGGGIYGLTYPFRQRIQSSHLVLAVRSKVSALMGIPVVVLILLFVVLGCVAMSQVPELARWIGTPGVVLFALASWSCTLTLVFVAGALALRLTSFAVLPLLIWLGTAYYRDANQFPRRDLSEAAASQRAADIHPPPSLSPVFSRWILKFDRPEITGKIPVYLVSAEGGGIRAAYWTARVLAELDDQSGGRLARHVFAYSGVSGGSVGIAAFSSAMAAQVRREERTSRLEEFLGKDYLAPLIARFLITEPLWQLAPLPIKPRDAGFEEQFAQDWQGTFGDRQFSSPFLKAFSLESPDAPVIMFNATNVELGRRVVFSNLSIVSSTRDVYVPLVPTSPLWTTMADITVAEAAHLSARFPYVSPPASLVGYFKDDPTQASPAKLWGRVVDGGYLDNSGSLAIDDVMQQLLQLRTNAIRNASSGAASGDKARVDALLRRVVFNVVVIRNDPSAQTDGYPDIPTLVKAMEKPALSYLLLQPPSRATEEGAHKPQGQLFLDIAAKDFLKYLPDAASFSEPLAPPDTMMSARDARGFLSRASLKKVNDRVSPLQIEDCDREKKLTKPARAGPNEPGSQCAIASDQFDEISLSKEMRSVAVTPRRFQDDAKCKDVRLRKDVALGWVLADPTRRMLNCLARTSTDISRLQKVFEQQLAWTLQ